MTRRVAWILLCIGVIWWLLAWRGNPDDAIRGYLVAFVAVATVLVGALLQIAISHLTNARWFAVLRRVTLVIVGGVPVLLLLLVPILVNLRALYPWASQTPAVSAQQRWLAPPWFALRSAIYLLTWIVLAEVYRQLSRRCDAADAAGIARITRQLRRWSVITVVALGVTISGAAFDWVMSLDPAWHSTIFGVYVFAGAMMGALALIACSARVVAATHSDVAIAYTPGQSAALGKLLLTFALFWSYIAFSQFLIIWIADIPDESAWYVPRLAGAWRAVAWTTLLGQGAIPIVLLLSAARKRRTTFLALLGIWLLAVHYLDVAWLMLPSMRRTHAFVLTDLAGLLLVSAVVALVAIARARGTAWIPVGDPDLDRALELSGSRPAT